MKAIILTAALTAALAISATAASASTNAMATDWQRVDCGNQNAALAASGSSTQICRTRTRRVCRPLRHGGQYCGLVKERYCFQRPRIHSNSPAGQPNVRGRSRFQNR